MKNKGFLLVMGCTFAVGLLVVASANAALIAESGFNNSSGIADPIALTLGELDTQGGTGSGWTIPWTKYRPTEFVNGTSTVENTVYDEGDQAVVAIGDVPLEDWCAYGRGFTPQSQTDEKVLLEWSVRVASIPEGGAISMYFSDFDEGTLTSAGYNGTAGLAAIGELGAIKLNGGVSTKWAHGTIQNDTWYRMGMLCDLDTKTYRFSLDGEYTDVDWDFHSPGIDVNQLSAVVWVMSGEAYFDEFRISTISDDLIPGDANNDKKVNDTDAQTVAFYWGTGDAGFPAPWEHGNFNGDDVVDALDAAILGANWGDYTTPPGEDGSPVPEPSAMVLLLGLMPALLWGRRK